MNITIKFFSSLMEYLPANSDDNSMNLNVDNGATTRDILSRFKVPDEEIQTVMRNGVFQPEQDRDLPLEDGDTITVWPSIQGG